MVPRRWIVERTFLAGVPCRLKPDYECLPETTEALIYIATFGSWCDAYVV
jgi:hypothetical protein